MLKVLDMARLAESLDAPYSPMPRVAVDGARVSLFVSDDMRSWHRNESHDLLMFILEGVVFAEQGAQKELANEGEMLVVPRKMGHNVSSGMRSTVLMLEADEVDPDSNGHPAPPNATGDGIAKLGAVVNALQGTPFSWLPVGQAGRCQGHITRLAGKSSPYRASSDLLIVVYRGVMDYRGPETSGTVVGSQMLSVDAGTTISLESERGATVLILAKQGAALPAPISTGAAAG